MTRGHKKCIFKEHFKHSNLFRPCKTVFGINKNLHYHNITLSFFFSRARRLQKHSKLHGRKHLFQLRSVSLPFRETLAFLSVPSVFFSRLFITYSLSILIFPLRNFPSSRPLFSSHNSISCLQGNFSSSFSLIQGSFSSIKDNLLFSSYIVVAVFIRIIFSFASALLCIFLCFFFHFLFSLCIFFCFFFVSFFFSRS